VVPCPAAPLQALRLPVLPHKFVVPEPGIAKELFFAQWKANRCVCVHVCLYGQVISASHHAPTSLQRFNHQGM